MTPFTRIWVIADDLTGAAELAGVAHRRGFSASIVLGSEVATARADVVVFDTDSRLLPADDAAARVRALALQLRGDGTQPGRPDSRHGLAEPGEDLPRTENVIFKKTDSVLRGNVRAELEALALALDRTRVLLVPANPSQGRTIRAGIYRIHGVPLTETEFVRDPHHPARSPAVRELLGPGAMPLANGSIDAALPEGGLVIGEAATADDVVQWARRVDAKTLPGGGREFFEACLAQHGRPVGMLCDSRGQGRVLSRPALVVSGSLADAARNATAAARAAGISVRPIRADAESLSAAIEGTQRALATRGVAWAIVDCEFDPDPAAAGRFTAALAELARELFARGAFQHLVVEGGATAAAVLHALPVPMLNVTGEWGPGVVALAGGRLSVTMKPGSYAWPDNLTHFLRD